MDRSEWFYNYLNDENGVTTAIAPKWLKYLEEHVIFSYTCDATYHGGFICTRQADHKGAHIAAVANGFTPIEICAIWKNDAK